MKAPIKFTAVLLGLLVGLIVPGMAQDVEYDDMYFTKKDRKAKASNAVLVEEIEANAEEAQAFVQNNEGSYSEQNVNPEYISRYGVTNTAESTSGEDEYYSNASPQDYQGSDYQTPVVNNYNYYGGGGFGYPVNNFYSPWGFNRGWNVSIGIGFGFGWGGGAWGWGNPYRWGSPFYGGFYGGGWGYNPWYDPFWGYGYAGGWYGYGRPGWGYGGWGNPWGNTIIINNYPEYGNNVRRGAGPSRGSTGFAGTRRSSVSGATYGRTATDRSAVTSRTAVGRDYSSRSRTAVATSRTSRTADPQSNYYRRTRTASKNTAYSSRDVTSRTRSVSTSSNYSPRTRQAYSSSTRSTSRSYTPNSSYNRSTSPVYNGRSSSGNRTYTPSRSNSGSRSYTPSRSNSGSRSYTPSRSSSGSGYSPSRSSSGSGYSPSRSSSGGSRSSGGASRSSSGGSRSSGGSSRGN